MKITVLRGVSSYTVEAVLRLNGSPINLAASVSGVVFKARSNFVGAMGIERPCTIIDAPNGVVRLTLTAEDTVHAHTYKGVFEVQYTNGTTLPVPNTTHVDYKVLEGV